MRPLSPRRAVRGFTAVELMIVVVIVAILTAMAGPWMGQMVRTQRLRTASFDVLASLQHARSEAIKRNLSVTMAPVGADWSTGWTITDPNGHVLKRQNAIDTTSITGPATVVFNGTGRLNAAVAAFSLVSDVGAGQGVKHRCVTVDLSGRAVSKEAAC